VRSKNGIRIALAILVAVIAFSTFAALSSVATVGWPFPYYRTMAVSMSPTINPGDIYFVNRLAYNAHGPEAGDVIVFSGPTFSTAPGAPNTPGVKRVVAVPGDSLTMSDGIVRRNGKPVSEPRLGSRAPYRLEIRDFGIYVDGRPLDVRSGVFMPPVEQWSAPTRVPSGCYVVLGDNRANSVDSHIVGFVCPGLPTTIDGVAPTIVGRAILPPVWTLE
jgi:signal peptidase I